MQASGGRRPHRTLMHPAVAMIGFWVALYLGYAVAPIIQTPPPSLTGFGFNFAFVLLYAAACWAGGVRYLRLAPAADEAQVRAVPAVPARLVLILALLGCAGAILSIVDKAGGAMLELLIDAASLRNERAQQLLEAAPNPGGIESAIAFLLYPAGYAAVYAAMLSFERLPARVSVLAFLFVPLTFVQSVAAGGRSGILVLLLLIGVAAHVRRFRGQSAFPRTPAVKWSSVLLVAAFLLYSSAVWFVRAELSGLTINSFLDHAESAWGVKPSPWLEAFADEVDSPALTQTAMSTAFYFTQALSVTERLLSMPLVPTLLGGYHIDVVAAAMRATSGTRDFLADGYAELLDANVYGFFTGAWSALFIDFGLWGAIAFTIAWGLLAGRSFQAMRSMRSDVDAALYGFWMYATLISFVSPPLGFSNSSITFFWFLFLALAASAGRLPAGGPAKR